MAMPWGFAETYPELVVLDADLAGATKTQTYGHIQSVS